MPKNVERKYMYQYGSEAKAYYEALPRPRIEPEYKPVPAPAPRKKLDIVFGFKLSLCGITVFMSSFAYIHTYSSLITKQQELQSLKKEMRELKSTISLTESKISENLNLDAIRERASKQLGMREPAPHQIVYIQLPQQSYTVYEK